MGSLRLLKFVGCLWTLAIVIGCFSSVNSLRSLLLLEKYDERRTNAGYLLPYVCSLPENPAPPATLVRWYDLYRSMSLSFVASNRARFLCYRLINLQSLHRAASSKVQLSWSTAFVSMENSSSFSLHSATSICGGGGGGRGLGMRNDRSRGRGHGGSGGDKIDSLGRILTRILRHQATELNLNMRSDGYVKVQDLLKLNLKTFAQIPLCSHTLDDVKEAVRRDNKLRFSLLEENRELFIRANQGHSVKTVETESLLKPILSADEVPVCIHGTCKKNLGSILDSGIKRMNRLHIHFSSGLPTDGEVISGMRRDVDVLIFLDVRKALAEGMKLYMSDNKVILTEGFNGVVTVKFFEKIESWPQRRSIPYST